MKVKLKRTLISKRFGLILQPGITVEYDPELKAVTHPQIDVWISVTDNDIIKIN